MLKHYAALLAETLPPQRAVLLSDDARQLQLLQAYTASSRQGKDYLFLDTAALSWPQYHRFLKKSHPRMWEAILLRKSCNEPNHSG